MPQIKKLKIGVIGTGKIAHVAHLPVLASLPDVEISAILSARYEDALCAAAQYGAKKACATLDEFLSEELDCAVLLTPKTVRKQYLVPLLENKLDVLCEKPLAMTMQECEYLAEQSAKSGRIVMVAFNRRFAPCNAKAISAFADKKPHLVVAQKCREFKEYRATLENAIHMVDLMRHFLGECDRVEAFSSFTDPFYEELCTAQMHFENGSLGLLGASRQAGQWYEHVELYGDGKTAVVDNLDSCRIIYPDHEEGITMTPLHQGWCDTVTRLGFKPCVEHFIDCVRTRKTPITSAEDAYRTHELMNRILQSAGLPDLSREWGDHR